MGKMPMPHRPSDDSEMRLLRDAQKEFASANSSSADVRARASRRSCAHAGGMFTTVLPSDFRLPPPAASARPQISHRAPDSISQPRQRFRPSFPARTPAVLARPAASSAQPVDGPIQRCPRCGVLVPGLQMLEYALYACPRSPFARPVHDVVIIPFSGKPSAQHDECAD